LADLSDTQAAESVKIIGSNTTGVETTPVNSTSNGALHVNLQNSSGTEIGTVSNPVQVAGTFTATTSIDLGDKKTYVCNSGPITGSTSVGTKSLLYIFHPISSIVEMALVSVYVSQIAGNGPSSAQRIELRRLTAENLTPGGTSGTVFTKRPTDTASLLTLKIAPTGAPTRSTGALVAVAPSPTINGEALLVGFGGIESITVSPWIVPTLTAGGYEITQEVTATLSSAPVFNVTIEWTET
jgi:hypothetical protein